VNRRALRPGERADLRGHVDVALEQIRLAIETAPDVGPLLIAAYRALSTLRELRETVEELPEMAEGRLL
jgi:hypothetical protein